MPCHPCAQAAPMLAGACSGCVLTVACQHHDHALPDDGAVPEGPASAAVLAAHLRPAPAASRSCAEAAEAPVRRSRNSS